LYIGPIDDIFEVVLDVGVVFLLVIGEVLLLNHGLFIGVLLNAFNKKLVERVLLFFEVLNRSKCLFSLREFNELFCLLMLELVLLMVNLQFAVI